MEGEDNPLSWDEAKELIKDGFRPHIKRVGEKVYITLRKKEDGRTIERGFGEYTEEKLRMLMEMCEEYRNLKQTAAEGEEPFEQQGVTEDMDAKTPSLVDEDFLPLEEATRRAEIDESTVSLLVRKGILKEGVHYKTAVIDGAEVVVYDWRKLVEAKKRLSELMSETDALNKLDRVKEEIIREVSGMLRRSMEELREAMVREISSYVDSRLSRAEVVPAGEIHLRIPSHALGRVTVTLRPEIVLYYGYINKLWRDKTGRDLTLQDFINQILKEHLEGCIGLYTALGREVEVETGG